MDLKEEIEKMELRVKELEEENAKLKDEKGWLYGDGISDRALTHGLFAVNTDKLPENYQKVKIDIKLFENLWKALKIFGKDDIYVYVKNDFPLVITTDKDSNVGFVLAPKGEG